MIHLISISIQFEDQASLKPLFHNFDSESHCLCLSPSWFEAGSVSSEASSSASASPRTSATPTSTATSPPTWGTGTPTDTTTTSRASKCNNEVDRLDIIYLQVRRFCLPDNNKSCSSRCFNAFYWWPLSKDWMQMVNIHWIRNLQVSSAI